jgi:hypothetical protein
MENNPTYIDITNAIQQNTTEIAQCLHWVAGTTDLTEGDSSLTTDWVYFYIEPN